MNCSFQALDWVLCLFGKKMGEYEAMTLLCMIKEKGHNFFKS